MQTQEDVKHTLQTAGYELVIDTEVLMNCRIGHFRAEQKKMGHSRIRNKKDVKRI